MIITHQHPLLTLSTDFSQLCSVLDNFHINHVTYIKRYHDGTRVGLANKPQWIEDYYNLSLYKSSLFETAEKTPHHSDFGVWIGEYDLDVYQHGKDFYNTYHSITISEPVNDGCEFYLFSCPKEHAAEIHYLSNHMEILYHFILFIKDRGRKLFSAASKNKITLPKISEREIPVDYIDADFALKMDAAAKQFLRMTPVHRFQFESDGIQGVHLTQRELQCVSHLLDYKTALEIAELMNVSRRTIESYLDNVKNKLNCSNLKELKDLLKLNKYMDAIN